MSPRLSKLRIRIVTGILVVILLPILVPVVAAVLAWVCVESLILVAYRTLHRDRVFLVCTGRRGWRELLENNVIPELPDGVEPVWGGGKTYAQRLVVRRHRAQRPYLLLLRGRKTAARSLNTTLQSWKNHGARNQELATKIRKLLDVELAALRRQAST